MIIALGRFAAAAGAFVLYLAALGALCFGDRIRFRRRHGQAALDAFDAECSRVDEELDRPAGVVPIDRARKHSARIRRGGAA